MTAAPCDDAIAMARHRNDAAVIAERCSSYQTLAEESTLGLIPSGCEGIPPTDTIDCSSARPHRKSGSALDYFAGTREGVCNLTGPGKNQDYTSHTRSFQADSQYVVSHSRLELLHVYRRLSVVRVAGRRGRQCSIATSLIPPD